MLLFSPPPSDEQKPVTISTAAAIAISLVISLVLAGGFVLFARTSSMLVAPLVVTIVLALVFALIRQTRQQALAESAAAADEKPKRFAPGQDMYTLIDRMVDDLDADELAYLRRRLDEQEQASEDNLAQSMAELLEKRAELRGKD